MVKVEVALCSGCGTCVEICPAAALRLVGQKAAVDEVRCTGCGMCLDACPTGAISALAPMAQTVPAASLAPRPGALAADSRNPPLWLTVGMGFLERFLMPMAAERLLASLERRVGAATASPAARKANRLSLAPADDPALRRRHRWRARGG